MRSKEQIEARLMRLADRLAKKMERRASAVASSDFALFDELDSQIGVIVHDIEIFEWILKGDESDTNETKTDDTA